MIPELSRSAMARICRCTVSQSATLAVKLPLSSSLASVRVWSRCSLMAACIASWGQNRGLAAARKSAMSLALPYQRVFASAKAAVSPAALFAAGRNAAASFAAVSYFAAEQLADCESATDDLHAAVDDLNTALSWTAQLDGLGVR